jgi:hypothetical protein
VRPELAEPRRTAAEPNEAYASYDFRQTVDEPVRRSSTARRIGKQLLFHGI